MSIIIMKKNINDVCKNIISSPNKISLLLGRLYNKSIKINYGDTYKWFYKGVLHREDGPAVECKEYREWYINGIRVLRQDDFSDNYYDENGLYHREDGPSVINKCGCFYWYRHGQQHRDEDKPAVNQCNRHGSSIFYFKNSRLDRENGPAIITKINKKGDPSYFYEELWFRNGLKHREDGPAEITECNSLKELTWFKNGNRHRAFEPAYVKYKNGIKVYESYYLNNKLHNSIGPAIISYIYSKNDSLKYSSFYMNDKYMSLNTFIKNYKFYER